MVNWQLIACSERIVKQRWVMDALAKGMKGYGEVKIDDGDPLKPFVCAGQLWAVQRMVPIADRQQTPFWMIDNGYYMQSGKGRHLTGHWEFTYRGLEPIMIKEPDYSRLPYEQHVEPWRYDPDGDVLIGIPGVTFGRVFGMNMGVWIKNIESEVRRYTKKTIRTRDKWSKYSIDDELKGVSVLVTHSSHVAIDAIIRGIPAIVAPSSPAAPVCSHSLEDIDNPLMPEADVMRHWWASLMCQQFTVREIEYGLAWDWMKRIMEEVDGK